MKSIIALFICVCVLLSFSLSYAEIGFDKMTDEELILAQEELQNEIIARGLVKKATIPPGLYEVGVDIPVGKYVLTAVTVNPSKRPVITVYEGKVETYSYFDSIMWDILEDNGSCMVSLEDGQILHLESVSFTIEKYSLPSF